MQAAQPVRHRVWRSAGLGALGFGVGLALAGLILGALTYQIHDFDTGRLIGSMMYGAAGAVGGASLGWDSRSSRQALQLALAGALGLALGYFVTTTIISVWLDESPLMQGSIWLVVPPVQYALMGALTGALLGLVQRQRGRTGWLMLAGIIGFGVLYWPLLAGTFVVIEPMLRLLLGVNGSADFAQLGLLSAVRYSLSAAVTGAAAGACLGVGNAQDARPSLAGASVPVTVFDSNL